MKINSSEAWLNDANENRAEFERNKMRTAVSTATAKTAVSSEEDEACLSVCLCCVIAFVVRFLLLLCDCFAVVKLGPEGPSSAVVNLSVCL